MKKKFLSFAAVLLLIVMLFVLTGCGSNNGEENKKEKGKLADVVSIGDKIAYNPGEGTYTEEDIGKDGYENVKIDRTIHANDITTWVVIDVSDNGEVTIMAENPTEREVTLGGIEGYNKGPEILDKICQIFLNKDQGAKEARSIRIADINKIEEYTPKDNEETRTYQGCRIEIKSDGLLEEELLETWATDEIELTKTNETSEYSYETISDIFKGSSYYWIADRCYKFESTNFFCCLRAKGSTGYITDQSMIMSNGWGSSNDLPVMPVVVLKSSVKTSGANDSGIYELK